MGRIDRLVCHADTTSFLIPNYIATKPGMLIVLRDNCNKYNFFNLYRLRKAVYDRPQAKGEV